MSDETSPLLRYSGEAGRSDTGTEDHHTQFCRLIGTRPLTLTEDQKHTPHPESLYKRASSQHTQQHITYMFTATLTNTLMMSQIVLGAALTGLGASNASPVLVTIFGAMNTIIAGAIAFLKSRGQPMRARMFRDDLERVVDEIENSAIMWLGISRNVHGYDAIDTNDQVTVRSEVARLTRLYDKAVKTNTINDPDNYTMGGPSDLHAAALRDKSGLPLPAAPPPPAPAAAAETTPSASAPAPSPAPTQDPDASPVTKAPEPSKPSEADAAADTEPADPGADKGKEAASSGTQSSDQKAAAGPRSTITAENAPEPTPAPSAPVDPDASPASAAHLEKHSEDTSKVEDSKK